MANTQDFDPQALGLDSHYNEQQQHKIRRLILEDWHACGVKLPTYMKLVARFLIKYQLPEEWLKKLSHQTMDKMLKNTSTPRYPFWAALHLYLIKKYGDLTISRQSLTDTRVLGQALVRFSQAQIDSAFDEGTYAIDGVSIELQRTDHDYFEVRLTRTHQASDPFADEITEVFRGVGVVQDTYLYCVLRDSNDYRLHTTEHFLL